MHEIVSHFVPSSIYSPPLKIENWSLSKFNEFIKINSIFGFEIKLKM